MSLVATPIKRQQRKQIKQQRKNKSNNNAKKITEQRKTNRAPRTPLAATCLFFALTHSLTNTSARAHTPPQTSKHPLAKGQSSPTQRWALLQPSM
jgi:hypothetical protein